jgi:hypothetical protein
VKEDHSSSSRRNRGKLGRRRVIPPPGFEIKGNGAEEGKVFLLALKEGEGGGAGVIIEGNRRRGGSSLLPSKWGGLLVASKSRRMGAKEGCIPSWRGPPAVEMECNGKGGGAVSLLGSKSRRTVVK